MAAFGETIARFRPSLAQLAQLAEFADEPESFDPAASTSRRSPDRGWECWAVFVDRLRHEPERPVPVEPGDPDLRAAARVLGLVIEEHRGE